MDGSTSASASTSSGHSSSSLASSSYTPSSTASRTKVTPSSATSASKTSQTSQTSADSISQSGSKESSKDKGLSTGASIGIGVAIAVAAILAIGGGAFFVWRRERRQGMRAQATLRSDLPDKDPYEPAKNVQEKDDSANLRELPTRANVHEMEHPPSELPAH